MTDKTLYDQSGVRYSLASSNCQASFDWLFVPGGPGCSARYFNSLLTDLTLPGNVWLIDLPGNGDNTEAPNCVEYDFERWEADFLGIFKRFENPILVGHSFGGMFPLLFPELEDVLKGFVILNSAPCLWLEEAAKLAKENNITVLTDDMQEFEKNPNQQTFEKALLACLPYYFPAETLELGKKLLEDMPLNYHAAVWWLRKAHATNFFAKWIPQNVPTLIIGGTQDYIAPASLFERDQRFHRENITIKKINQAGHFPWIEDAESVIAEFDNFQSKLEKENSTR